MTSDDRSAWPSGSPDARGPVLLDGAIGTLLEARRPDLARDHSGLWSTVAVERCPDLLTELHAAHLEAGASILTTATFRLHRRALERAGRPARDGVRLARGALGAARRAIERTGCRGTTIATSIGPVEDCERPDLAPDEPTCHDEHARAIEDRLDAGAVHLLFETIGTAREAVAAAEAARGFAPGRWSIGLLAHAPGSIDRGPRLLGGDPIEDVLPALGGASMVGLNCLPAGGAGPIVEWLAPRVRSVLGPGVAVGVWANTHRRASGPERFRATEAVDPARYAEFAAGWAGSGASVIGGCCGTTPATIAAVARRLRAIGGATPASPPGPADGA